MLRSLAWSPPAAGEGSTAASASDAHGHDHTGAHSHCALIPSYGNFAGGEPVTRQKSELCPAPPSQKLAILRAREICRGRSRRRGRSLSAGKVAAVPSQCPASTLHRSPYSRSSRASSSECARAGQPARSRDGGGVLEHHQPPGGRSLPDVAPSPSESSVPTPLPTLEPLPQHQQGLAAAARREQALDRAARKRPSSRRPFGTDAASRRGPSCARCPSSSTTLHASACAMRAASTGAACA